MLNLETWLRCSHSPIGKGPIGKGPIAAALLVVGALGGGCTSTVTQTEGAGGDAAGAGGHDTTSVGGGGSGGSSASDTTSVGSGLPPAMIDCDDTCARGTPDGGCFPVAECQAFCDDNSASWVQVVADAFESCATEDFLCFQTIENCMWQRLYPDPIAHEVSVAGNGLAMYEGQAVTAGVEQSGQGTVIKQAVVLNGVFNISLDVVDYIGSSRVVMVWIEDDLDGQCTAADFVTSVATDDAGEDWLNPSFSATIGVDANHAPFVCNYLQ